MSDSFPYEWIKKKWKEGFFVTSLATSSQQWAVVMSRTSGFVDQAVELDFQVGRAGMCADCGSLGGWININRRRCDLIWISALLWLPRSC